MVLTVVTEGAKLLFPLLLLPLLVYILNHFKPSPLPPGPYPWPIIGNILQMGKKPHITLTHFAQSYGPLISVRLGTQILVVGSSPEAATEILKTHDRVLSGRYVPHVVPSKKPELNHLSLGWALECNESWNYLRSICRTELFSGKALESQARLREKTVMDLVEFLGTMEGKVVKVREVVFATVYNMVSKALISRDLIRLGDGNGDGGIPTMVDKIFKVVTAPNLADLFPILGGLDLQGLTKKSMDLNLSFYSVWECTIKERRKISAHGSRKQDFLDVLIENGFSDEQINQLLLELFAAGTDTSSSTIEWAMAELMKNPESMKKLEEELNKTIINKYIFEESNLLQLPYLQACVKETLRLHPPGPLLLPHRALDSCKVMNYTIPKNSQVLVNVWAIGRDPKIWDDPLLFKPERFINSTLDFKGNNFELLPFGSGRRSCPGLPLAAKHVPLVLASLIHFFDWSLPSGIDSNELDMSEKYGITLQKEQPLLLVPKVRK